NKPGEGMGIAFHAYESVPAAGYAGHVAHVSVDEDTGEIRVKRLIAVMDAGLVVNPNGLKNQMEGGAIQATSWTLKEQLQFDKNGIKTRDWASYPILQFLEVPEVDCVLIDRPDRPSVSIGEPVTTTI